MQKDGSGSLEEIPSIYSMYKLFKLEAFGRSALVCWFVARLATVDALSPS